MTWPDGGGRPRSVWARCGVSGRENERDLSGEMGDRREYAGVDLSLSGISTGIRERRRIVSSEKTLEKIGMGSPGAVSLEPSEASSVKEAFLIASHRLSSSAVVDSLVDWARRASAMSRSGCDLGFAEPEYSVSTCTNSASYCRVENRGRGNRSSSGVSAP
jgi:hypothetical protein